MVVDGLEGFVDGAVERVDPPVLRVLGRVGLHGEDVNASVRAGQLHPAVRATRLDTRTDVVRHLKTSVEA